jgi:hypothetical protein
MFSVILLCGGRAVSRRENSTKGTNGHDNKTNKTEVLS